MRNLESSASSTLCDHPAPEKQQSVCNRAWAKFSRNAFDRVARVSREYVCP